MSNCSNRIQTLHGLAESIQRAHDAEVQQLEQDLRDCTFMLQANEIQECDEIKQLEQQNKEMFDFLLDLKFKLYGVFPSYPELDNFIAKIESRNKEGG